jgi:uncharacterized membrane protein
MDRKLILRIVTVFLIATSIAAVTIGVIYITKHVQDIVWNVGIAISRKPMEWSWAFVSFLVMAVILITWNISANVWRARLREQVMLKGEELTAGELSMLRDRVKILETQLRNSNTKSKGRRIQIRKIVGYAADSLDNSIDSIRALSEKLREMGQEDI